MSQTDRVQEPGVYSSMVGVGVGVWKGGGGAGMRFEEIPDSTERHEMR